MAEKKTTAKTAPAPAVETVENPVNKMIDGLVEKAQAALKEFLTLDQEQIDHIVHEMALAGLDKHQELARMAVEETGRGVYEDKVIKNMFATEYIWHDIKKEKTVGVLDENEMEGYVEVAEPVGVIAGVTPTTNPTSTTLFKSLIAVKTRNPIIFGFHPSAQKCSAEAARIVYEAAVKAGAPENCIQWIDTPSIEATGALMNHPGVATILASMCAFLTNGAIAYAPILLGREEMTSKFIFTKGVVTNILFIVLASLICIVGGYVV